METVTSDYKELGKSTQQRLPIFGQNQIRRTFFRKSGRLPLGSSRFIPMYDRCLSDAHSNDVSAAFGEFLWIKTTKASRSRVMAKASQISRVSNPARIRGSSRRSSRLRSPTKARARPEFERTPPIRRGSRLQNSLKSSASGRRMVLSQCHRKPFINSRSASCQNEINSGACSYSPL
jgi:hypothetical protein